MMPSVVHARVYPRVCGGTPSTLINLSYHHGLSPRVRGNHGSVLRDHSITGSIPACAGEPHSMPAPAQEGGVYPRVCGGTIARARGETDDEGLSPRVRGNLPAMGTGRQGEGSIPACAGEPGLSVRARGARWVYPRVCGGTLRRLDIPLVWGGLSPRVRGNQDGRTRVVDLMGSIPACAGEPIFSMELGEEFRVYPRVCGGTKGMNASSPIWGGLSPRVRGNLRLVRGGRR